MSDPPPTDALWERLQALPDRDAPTSADTGSARHYHVPAPEQPTPEPMTQPRTPPTRRRRRGLRRTAIGLVVALVVAGVAMLLWGWLLWRGVERVPLDAVLSPPSDTGTNYLIVGTDSREGVEADVANAGAIFGDGSILGSGERTDTMVVLRESDAGNQLVALPRDLWLPIAETGGEQRLNTAFAGGPERLVRTVQDSLGIPIHHYLEVDFAGFLGLVDSIGGITIDFAHPATDSKSGLNVATSGPVELDADQALAYVRSRAYTETIDGQAVVDPSGDIGRVARQQAFLNAVFDVIGGTRNPITLLGIEDSLNDNIRIDDRWSFWGAFSFARRLDSLDPQTVVLPTFPFTAAGGVSVLGMAEGAEDVLAGFR